jgi:hypothetical protein
MQTPRPEPGSGSEAKTRQRPFVVTALVACCAALLVLATLAWLQSPKRVHLPADPTGPRRVEPEKSFAN